MNTLPNIEFFKKVIEEHELGKEIKIDEQSFTEWYDNNYSQVDKISKAPETATLKNVKILPGNKIVRLYYKANYKVEETRLGRGNEIYNADSFIVDLENGQDMPFDYEIQY